MPKTVEGQAVQFVFSNGKVRGATIVKVWSPESVNLMVHLDGMNDSDLANGGEGTLMNGGMWVTSVRYSEKNELRTWHWIEGSETLDLIDKINAELRRMKGSRWCSYG